VTISFQLLLRRMSNVQVLLQEFFPSKFDIGSWTLDILRFLSCQSQVFIPAGLAAGLTSHFISITAPLIRDSPIAFSRWNLKRLNEAIDDLSGNGDDRFTAQKELLISAFYEPLPRFEDR